jgi:predicted negative regulator of RcsB-dependent stress response
MTLRKFIYPAASIIAITLIAGGGLYIDKYGLPRSPVSFETTKFGGYLAAQHAIYQNDFVSAQKFLAETDSDEGALVKFLAGINDDSAKQFAKSKGMPDRLIYTVFLAKNGNWADIYPRYKSEKSFMDAPWRIWSAVATGKSDEAIRFIGSINSVRLEYRAFIRGQIYAYLNKNDQARKEFDSVPPEFMNLNDYLYALSFYAHAGFSDSAASLRDKFTSQTGGLFLREYDIVSDWGQFSGLENNIAFGIIQNISHNQFLSSLDISLVMLRAAQIIGGDSDALNFYLGSYFNESGGDYNAFFSKIAVKSPYYPFALMKIADSAGNLSELNRVLRANPLFIPALQKIVAKNIQKGRKNDALRGVNHALAADNLPESGRAFLLKLRGDIYLRFGDLDRANEDITMANDILPNNADIIESLIFVNAARGIDLAATNRYAMMLVNTEPARVENWDALGFAVMANEGNEAALEIYERVGRVAETCSSLFEHLGDLQARRGNKILAADAYKKAIALSDDGRIVVRQVEKKLKQIGY